MVLTRSERNRLIAAGIDVNSVMNRDELPITSGEAMVPPAVPTVAVSTGNATNVTETVTPAVQQFLAMAQGNANNSFVQEAHHSSSTIPTPEYSNITSRTRQGEFHINRPTVQPSHQRPVVDLGGDIASLIREELSRQMQQLQVTMQQEISQAVRQAIRPQANPASGGQGSNLAAPNTPQAELTARTPHLFGAGSNQNFNLGINQANNLNIPAFHRTPAREFHSAPYPPPGMQPQAAPLQPSPVHLSTQAHRPADSTYPVVKADLSKWGLKFDGTSKSMSAEDFVFRLETLRQDYNMSIVEIKRSFHTLLEGQALEWYWNVKKLNPFQSWDELIGAFLTQYRRYENEFQIQKRIMDRRQGAQESFEDFFNAVISLRNQQRTPYSESDLIEIMRGNLKPSLSQLLFSARIQNLNDFCQQAKRAESLVSSQRQQYAPRHYIPARVHELDYQELPEPVHEIEALASSSRYICWNCKRVGHGFTDCPSPTRRIFCYRCGLDNVVTPQCPKCRGNQTSNASRTGEACSTHTQTQ